MDDVIMADLRESYGITCTKSIPVIGGWLNKKWKIISNRGELLVKQFSNLRYSKKRLILIEAALQRQIALRNEGVPCPFIWKHDGRAIRLVSDEIAYMVMDFCAGWEESPDTITLQQIHSLGSVCGLMHKGFLKLPIDKVEGFHRQQGVIGLHFNNHQILDSLWDNYHNCMRDGFSDTNIEYKRLVTAQKPILEGLTKSFFDRQPKGIAHEDFSPDNILFNNEGVSVIVDFDRNRYSYIRHDIGRVLLSLTLKSKHLDMDKIHSFIKGYSQYIKLTMPDIEDALRIAWCIEIPWWIQPQYFSETKEKILRFRNEMIWLTENWFQLDSLLSSY